MERSTEVRRPIWLAGLGLVVATFTGAHFPELPYVDNGTDVAAATRAQPVAAAAAAQALPSSAAPAPEAATEPVVAGTAALAPEGAAAPDPAPAAPAPAVPLAVQVAVPAAPAAAAPATSCAGAGWQQRRGQAAFASLRAAPMGDYSLSFLPAKDGFLGLTRPALRAVEVYVRPCPAESDALLRHVVAHELGHAWDKSRLTDSQRTAWLAARGIPASTPWQGCNRCTDFATPAGDFAEVYAQWRTGETTNHSQLGNAPAPAQLQALAAQFFGG